MTDHKYVSVFFQCRFFSMKFCMDDLNLLVDLADLDADLRPSSAVIKHWKRISIAGSFRLSASLIQDWKNYPSPFQEDPCWSCEKSGMKTCKCHCLPSIWGCLDSSWGFDLVSRLLASPQHWVWISFFSDSLALSNPLHQWHFMVNKWHISKKCFTIKP